MGGLKYFHELFLEEEEEEEEENKETGCKLPRFIIKSSSMFT